MFTDTTVQEIDVVMNDAWSAFHQFKNTSLRDRADFLRRIATGLENSGDDLIRTAMEESNLPEARLKNERGRTIFQLTSYAEACERGDWLQARIDTANAERTPPKPDIRKMMTALGPVVVFGSSNFPFAFSTAGGDTASALAAGCPVIVKAHPAHPQTSTRVAEIIFEAAKASGLPRGVFSHVYGAGFEVGEALVKHHRTRAVGFTGSYAGGKQLFDWGNQRKEPIPVFAEMGSINPIFLFPEKSRQAGAEVAKMFAGSVTLGVGQFCTNPGLLIGVEGEDLQQFLATAGAEIKATRPAKMLHPGIANAFNKKRTEALAQAEVQVIAESEEEGTEHCGAAVLATVSADAFLDNPLLHQEVFGPYSLIVRCRDLKQMEAVIEKLEGQITCTLMATPQELQQHAELVSRISDICGRIILNNVPTGVEVCLSMQHGGPFPASSDSRFTSVGADSINRFVRPVSYQNFSNELLPDALKNENPLNIYRTVNNSLSREPLGS